MVTQLGKKVIGFTVDDTFPFGGAEVKQSLTTFFQFMWNSAAHIMEQYEEFEKIKEMLSTW